VVVLAGFTRFCFGNGDGSPAPEPSLPSGSASAGGPADHLGWRLRRSGKESIHTFTPSESLDLCMHALVTAGV
jgi:hypothetical protein